MLTATMSIAGTKVMALDVQKTQGPFLCTCCEKDVVLKKGQRVVHHFAHKAVDKCSGSEGETAEHFRAKMAIYEALRLKPNVTELEVERRFDLNIADVFARINGVPVAIEVQRSVLTPEKIVERTSRYHQQGIAVLWIGLPPKSLSGRYTPRPWELWSHATYYGKVYFWLEGSKLQPVHFNPYMIDKPAKTWFGPGGVEQSAGGYQKRSKKWFTPLLGTPVDIAQDFRCENRDPFARMRLVIPRCTIYKDVRGTWWLTPKGVQNGS